MTPIWLNLCAGGNTLPAPWRNHDRDMDLNNPLPFADNTVDRIFIEHGLEHIDSAHGMRFLAEAHRVLKPGGVIRICVPELARLDSAHIRDICTGHGHQQIYSEQTLRLFLFGAGFALIGIETTCRKETDGHWKVIGEAKDNLETLRMEATKL